ncbi:hypothetical protein [Haloferula sp. A504]|uniref:hypothetical protein n=1 Tax=Haloferula sp. A504 TaxID=3373601 RepID=UPI0031CB54BF|nr:hypothetical protein [Verrucomicrobiaceae bacterium E54]
MKFYCPHCGQSIEAGDSLAGVAASCPNCSKSLVVPGAPTAELGRSDAGQGRASSERASIPLGDGLSDWDAALIVSSAISSFDSARKKRRKEALVLAAICLGTLGSILFLAGVPLSNLVGAGGVLLVILGLALVWEFRKTQWNDGANQEEVAQRIVLSSLDLSSRPLGQLIALENEARLILDRLQEGQLDCKRQDRKLVCEELLKQIEWRKRDLQRK